MSQAIKLFLNDLKDWRKNFSIENYDYNGYSCEIADIAKMQAEKNTKGLVEFGVTKVKISILKLNIQFITI